MPGRALIGQQLDLRRMGLSSRMAKVAMTAKATATPKVILKTVDFSMSMPSVSPEQTLVNELVFGLRLSTKAHNLQPEVSQNAQVAQRRCRFLHRRPRPVWHPRLQPSSPSCGPSFLAGFGSRQPALAISARDLPGRLNSLSSKSVTPLLSEPWQGGYRAGYRGCRSRSSGPCATSTRADKQPASASVSALCQALNHFGAFFFTGLSAKFASFEFTCY